MATNVSLSRLPDLDQIYKNLLTSFDPASKRLIQAGRELWRAWIAVSEAMRAYAEALDRLGVAGSNCGGETREIGQCLLQISEMLKELHKHEKSTIQFYESQVLVPTDANLDQDSKVLVEQRRNFEKKLKQLGDRVKRDRKRGIPTEQSERMFRDYQADCVKQALTEEKKRYTYMLDRHCALATWQLQFYRTAVSLYDQNVQKWKDACANPEELSAAALAALDAAIQPYATQSSVSLSTVSRAGIAGIRTLSNTESDAISNSLPPTPTVREQGVGTFHINEGETVKATLGATAVLLQNQPRQDRATPKNGQITDRLQIDKASPDPPSTGSSTLSSASRYASAADPALTAQERATSTSSLVKKTYSATQAASPVSPNVVLPGKEKVDYAVAVKPRQSATVVKSETLSLSSGGAVLNAKQASPVSAGRRRAVAMFTYSNAGSNQLSFQEGDPIMVIQDGQQGWQFGENLSTGKRGWYPASFTRSEVEPLTYQYNDGPPQPRPRSQSSSTSAVAQNGGHNGYNGNGVKHSPPNENDDHGTNGRATIPASSKAASRPVSVMVLQNSTNPATQPTYRPAPPPPATTSPPAIAVVDDEDPAFPVEKNQSNQLRLVNCNTVPQHNPFAHIKLRHVVKTDGAPKKYG